MFAYGFYGICLFDYLPREGIRGSGVNILLLLVALSAHLFANNNWDSKQKLHFYFLELKYSSKA